ncbi:putative glycosidase [Medicago truncatula]|uniref:Putative glycosidase n=1 Tax=Medicago truncatula TaxID=3880 RepID=A0A396GW11_MEDTR|nr:putative glycosidase [Medicago truncatula]
MENGSCQLPSIYGTKKIRTYAHCAKETVGRVVASHTLLLLNLDNSTTVDVQVTLNYVGESQRREYHLTAKDGNLRCQTMLLNGNILSVNSAGDIPLLNPINNQLILQLTLQKYDKAKK